jgi:hypothetical protein
VTKIEFVAMLAIAAVVAVVVLGLAWELLRPSRIPPRLRFDAVVDLGEVAVHGNHPQGRVAFRPGHPHCRGALTPVEEVGHEPSPGCEAFRWPARTITRTDKAPAEHVREAVAAFLAGGPDYRRWS